LREQYAIEQELARRLREAPETRGLYSAVYDELLQRVPHLRKHDDGALVPLELKLLEPFLNPGTRFLEIGGGNCALAIALSKRLPRSIAIEATAMRANTSNFELVVADTPPYPLPDSVVDLAFSSHMIEHLRPDDALLHMKEVRRLLAPDGRYICVTPNRLWGPHDISRYFSDEPQGLHLREYTHNELLRLMKRAGFRRCRVIARIGSGDALVPHLATRVLEFLPRGVLRALSRGRSAPFRLFEQVIVVGQAGTPAVPAGRFR